jgi:uncharacterized protein YndB with AHSA1/START domain
MTQRSAVHATFSLERVYDATPARVFKAFADPAAKRKWFGGPSEWLDTEQSYDFRVGGRETSKATPPGGESHAFNAIYQDIVPNERIVYTYDMHIGSARISVSLATVEFKPQGSGCRLVLTEQGVFLDGYDDAGSREEGTAWLLGKLGDSLKD